MISATWSHRERQEHRKTTWNTFITSALGYSDRMLQPHIPPLTSMYRPIMSTPIIQAYAASGFLKESTGILRSSDIVAPGPPGPAEPFFFANN